MAKAILRTKKHKTSGTLAASSRHTFREEDTPNADPSRTDKNRLVIGSGNINSDVHRRIKESDVSVSKNSVLAVEFMLTASPEFFGGNGFGDWDKKKTEAFIDRATDFMKNKYGDDLVSLAVHLDEKTPHLVGHVVPVNKKTGRLSAKALITGGREKLSELQDDYAKTMKPLGLERGQKGSKAEHKSVKRWYGRMSSIDKLVKNKQKDLIEKPPILNREKWMLQKNTIINNGLEKLYAENELAKDEKESALKRALAAEEALEKSSDYEHVKNLEIELKMYKDQLKQLNEDKAAREAMEKRLGLEPEPSNKDSKRFTLG